MADTVGEENSCSNDQLSDTKEDTDIKTMPKEEESSKNVSENGSQEVPEGHGAVVAEHYNKLPEKGLVERNRSRIVHLRNFNNWVKSMLINEYLDKVREAKGHGAAIRVLDIGCGKGGDLLKWKNGNISHLICADLAKTSVEQCQSRFNDLTYRSRRDRFSRVFTAEFITADCTKTRLREHYKDPSLQLDLVSCQFSFHYSFESLPQAECMLRNSAECLRPGGYFIGTIPDANDIVARYRANGCKSFGNDVYSIALECETDPPPLFGAKYGFNLEGVVDCPEFLVYFPTLVKLAKKFGLELVNKERFEDYFERRKSDGRSLLEKMQAFETYPASHGSTMSGNTKDYEHAEEYIKDRKVHHVGTLSRPEWEAASLYLAFAFRKVKVEWNAEGKPVYVNEESRKRSASSDEDSSSKKHQKKASSDEDSKRHDTDDGT